MSAPLCVVATVGVTVGVGVSPWRRRHCRRCRDRRCGGRRRRGRVPWCSRHCWRCRDRGRGSRRPKCGRRGGLLLRPGARCAAGGHGADMVEVGCVGVKPVMRVGCAREDAAQCPANRRRPSQIQSIRSCLALPQWCDQLSVIWPGPASASSAGAGRAAAVAVGVDVASVIDEDVGDDVGVGVCVCVWCPGHDGGPLLRPFTCCAAAGHGRGYGRSRLCRR